MRYYLETVSSVALSVLLSSVALVAAVAVADRGPGTDPGNVRPAPVPSVTCDRCGWDHPSTDRHPVPRRLHQP